ncbi:AMP-dependent synthetase and ligase [Halococcus morrhuae DSM 1307]|uniref:AMP-dependent synthetase and ligase n=1 Tax=Halococcus morrhuae DSM 1307 TaxID=931277 RepID=M0MFU5_HALMO|nr:AMP-binding protein [Halococcus morrhuae]EMA44592.1 AMP-dependent synthetase and ligase [Halococcus morrhuae DSM 1307]
MAWTVSLDGGTYEEARASFAWDLPDDYNLAHDLLRKHDQSSDRIALYQAYPDGRRETYTFEELDRYSSQLANALEKRGIERGDRVGVVVPQKPSNPITHLACWKIGAVSLPLSVLFGDESLRHRLDDSGAKAVVADTTVVETVVSAATNCPALETIVEVTDDDLASEATTSFSALVEGESEEYEIAETTAETPAIIMYTSGSTGPPKGALHGHGVWVGHCPAFSMYFERRVHEGVYWTPADWAWIGALGDLLFPAWHYGRPVVGYPMGKFDPETAFSLMEEFEVTNAFVPPTAIRMLMGIEDPRVKYDLSLRAVCSGGEPLTPEILDWADEELSGVVVNELYGQTEANLLVTNCQEWFSAHPGSMGKAVPGHDVAVIDPETGEERPAGETGEIAVRHGDDPVIFQEYWNQPEKTANATIGEWHLTGDLGTVDESGYVWFKSRDDDLILTSGYRVGPGEVERTVLEHAGVEQVGVIGIADETRGEIIKAFVQPISGSGSSELKEEIRDLVRDQLAKYEYPREIEFVEQLPQTTTGKIQRRKLREHEQGSE